MAAFLSGTRTLYVEGADDEHAIGQLLIRCNYTPEDLPVLKASGNKEKVLEAIRIAIRAGTGKSLGFVLDANADPRSTWESAASRLREVGVDSPDEIPAGGFAGESKTYNARVGVWLMPDCRQTGALEDFLQDLIYEHDPLLPHAEDSVSKAKQLGARFSDVDTRKAVLHTWLAWQKQQGRPYGVAIKARYFGTESVAAHEFVAWFESVFGITAGQ